LFSSFRTIKPVACNIPLQVLHELQVNFTKNEFTQFFHLINQFPKQITIHWEKAKIETVRKYQNLGCDLGDAIIAAHLEELAINMLVSENRHFLEKIKDLPFRSLNSTKILFELDITI
jgi:hypothetical protein